MCVESFPRVFWCHRRGTSSVICWKWLKIWNFWLLGSGCYSSSPPTFYSVRWAQWKYLCKRRMFLRKYFQTALTLNTCSCWSRGAVSFLVKWLFVMVSRHEYASGYYKVVSYLLSKLVADLIPMRTIPAIVFCAVTYWMVGKGWI